MQADLLARLATGLPDFFLTGGSALGEFYLGHRSSEDLDLFTTQAPAFEEADARVRRVAEDAGLRLTVARSAPGFRRYVLEGPDEQVVVDLQHDAVPQVEPDKPVVDGIRTDTLREIAVNKLCALLGRWEDRDLVDLYFIERAGLDPVLLLGAARSKDGGLTAATLAYALGTAPRVTLPQGLRLPVTVDELTAFRAGLVERLVRLGAPPR
jgi:hypothetical protein